MLGALYLKEQVSLSQRCECCTLAGAATLPCGEVIRALQTSAEQKACGEEKKPLPFQREVPGGLDGAQLQSTCDVSSGSHAARGNPISPRLSAAVHSLLFTCTSHEQPRAQRQC